MKKDFKKERAKAAKHARLMAKRPELRAALYGSKREGSIFSPGDLADQKAGPRETAQQKDTS
jgi:hypothetical protein